MSVDEDSDTQLRYHIDDGIDGSMGTVTPGVYYPNNKVNSHQKPLSRKFERYVFKNGDLNIKKFKHKNNGIFTRWFMTMVEARWRWTLLHFFVVFTCEWLCFGFVYWMISLVHGDLSYDHLPQNRNGTQWTPCIQNIYGFTSTFLFSIEIHSTIAYGHRKITLDCPQAIIAMCLQCIFSSIFQTFMVGILFAKLTRPKARTQTMLFSKHAVVNLRDDKLCIVFRVGDIRKSRILNIKASLYALKLELNADCEGVSENFEQIEMKVEMDGCESLFFLWPLSVIHVIDESSPLYNISAADLLSGKLELLIVFEGIIESTGQPLQARSSYIESDILWGHRFVPMVLNNDSDRMYDVDYSKVNVTEQVDTPLCSACEYNSVIMLLESDDCSMDKMR